MTQARQTNHHDGTNTHQTRRASLELARNLALQFLVVLSLTAIILWPKSASYENWLAQSGFHVNPKTTFTSFYIAVVTASLSLVLMTPISSLLGILGCLILANSFDRYSSENIWNHYLGINLWLALSVLIGTILTNREKGFRTYKLPPFEFWLIVSFMTWVCISEFSHSITLNSTRSFPLRTWCHALSALSVVPILSQKQLRVWEVDCFALSLAIPLCLRRFYVGENLHLNHDVPTFAVMTIPFLIVSSTRGHIFKRLFSVLLALLTFYLILETENRGGFVGIAFSFVGVLICFSWKTLPAILFIAPGLLWLLNQLKPSYFERFTDIVENGPASETFFSRFTVYGIALSLPLSTYAIGTGLGRFNTGFVSENPNLSQINAHNGWLSMLVELGIPGLAFYLLLMVCAFRHAFQVAKRGSNPYRWIGFACVCAIFGYTGLNLSIARDLFLPFYIVVGISLNLAHFDANIDENRQTG
jgi:hypothetical protein